MITITTVVDLEKALSPKNSCRTTLQTILCVCGVCGCACVCKRVCVCVLGGGGIRLHRWVCVRSSMGACVAAVAASRIPSATRLCLSRLSGVVAEPMAEKPESRRGLRRHQHRRTLHPGENCGEKGGRLFFFLFCFTSR